jgi:heat shock protein HtpX
MSDKFKDKSFYAELERLKKGIRIAWVINFAILFLTIDAAFIFIFLDTDSSNTEIGSFLVVSSGISLVLSLLSMLIVSRNTSKILMGAPGSDSIKLTEGQLYNIVEECSIAAGLQTVPDVFLSLGSGVMNAYAVSDAKTSRVIITDELAKVLNREEIKSVLAHEIGHIVSGDSAAMTKLVGLTSTVSIISGLSSRMLGFGNNKRSDDSNGTNPIAIVLIVLSLVFLLVAPLLSKIAESYMSRDRESQADAMSVKITRNPTPLATALLKLDSHAKQTDKEAVKKFQSKAGNLAFYASPLSSALSTHPPTEQRVKALIGMGANVDMTD